MFYSLNIFLVGIMVSEIPRVSVFGYFPLPMLRDILIFNIHNYY